MKWYNEVSMSFAYLVRPQISIDIDLEAYSIQLLADVIKNCFLRPGRTQSGPFYYHHNGKARNNGQTVLSANRESCGICLLDLQSNFNQTTS